jgi:hypothetical protein
VTAEVSRAIITISGMNGLGTARNRPLPPGFLSAGWLDGNAGENRVVQALSQAGIRPESGLGDVLACHQQHRVGDHTLDFAWPMSRLRRTRVGRAVDLKLSRAKMHRILDE